MDVNGAQINLCELVEDYGYFPSFSGERLIWNMAVFPKTGKREVFLKSIKDLGVPVKPDCKEAPRIRQLKECFVFEKSKFEKIIAMIEKAVRTR